MRRDAPARALFRNRRPNMVFHEVARRLRCVILAPAWVLLHHDGKRSVCLFVWRPHMQSSPQNAIDAGERAAVASPGSRPRAEPRSYGGRWNEEDRAFEAKTEHAPIGHFHRTPRQNRLLAALDATD